MTISNSLGNNIRKYMKLCGMTAAKVCQDLNIPRNTFSYWLNGKSFPRYDRIEMLASYFKTSATELLAGNNGDYLVRLSEPLLVELFEAAQDFCQEDLCKLVEYAKMLKLFNEKN